MSSNQIDFFVIWKDFLRIMRNPVHFFLLSAGFFWQRWKFSYWRWMSVQLTFFYYSNDSECQGIHHFFPLFCCSFCSLKFFFSAMRIFSLTIDNFQIMELINRLEVFIWLIFRALQYWKTIICLWLWMPYPRINLGPTGCFFLKLEGRYVLQILRNCLKYLRCSWNTTQIHLHKPKLLILHFPTPKKLILQFSTSNVWKNANHTIFIQFQKTIEKSFNIVSSAIWTKFNNLVMKKDSVYFFWKKMVILQFPYMKIVW